MLCQKCHDREATIHLTLVMGEKMTKRDLCEACGHEFKDPARGAGLTPFAAWPDAREQVLDGLVTSDSRYPKAAYLFVQEGLARAQKMFWQPGEPRHVSGAELLEALRVLAIESFGKQARAQLNRWGIFKCEDFGEIVFNLIKVGLLAKQETDARTDFAGGYDFDTAFPA